MNVPNMLTLSRFFLTCLFVILAQTPGWKGAGLLLFVFAIASLTDWADGFMARKYNLSTTFGQIMDPIADKFLTLAAFFIFAFEGTIALWMVVLVAAREMVVTASRIHAMTRGQVIPAEKSGKIKTVFQMTTIIVILLYRVLATAPLTKAMVTNYEIHWQIFVNLLMIIVVALTVVSGIGYFNAFKDER
ncbi:MAG: CDP-diacylglycerol--glycerol-3-phosphate 3-phosphatidyltransferase [Candidatus Omnitrophica bacterium]|nr:CDP-diacylglycerol--glycerol-3-phosphate 3-phosphatidyltransferase [Candidatus Omnitrophota bacterium]